MATNLQKDIYTNSKISQFRYTVSKNKETRGNASPDGKTGDFRRPKRHSIN